MRKYQIVTDTMADGSERITVRFLDEINFLDSSLGVVADFNGEPKFSIGLSHQAYRFKSVENAKMEIDRDIAARASITVAKSKVINYPS
jgi:hypothetical protein